MHPIRLLTILLLLTTTAATAQQGSSVYSKAAIDGKVNSLTALTTTHTAQIAGLASITATLSSVQATQATVIAAHTTAIAAGPPAGSITNARLATAPASTFKGNNTTATAPVSDLSLTDTRIMLGFDQINNTSDAGKPISTATQAAISSLALSSLQSLTSVSAMATRTEATVRYDNSDWKRVAGSITLDNVLFASGGTGFYYARQLTGPMPFRLFGGDPANTDNSAALQAAVNAQVINGRGIIVDVAGTYRFLTTVTKAQSFTGLSIRAEPGLVVFDYSGGATGTACLKVVGGSGKLTNSVIYGIRFVGNANTVGLEIAGQCGQRYENCTFGVNLVGVRLHNDATGSFTEYSIGRNCTWETACQYAIQYKKTSGNNSFHGSGLEGTNTINASTSGVILIDEGCLPYNVPLSCQVWVNGSATFIINNNTTAAQKPYFTGNISFEHFTGTLTLGSGLSTYFSGPINAFGDYVDMGTLYRCEGVVVNQNNSTLAYGIKWNAKQLLGAGSTTIPKDILATGTISVQVVGANYDKEYLLYINPKNQSGGAGSVITLANTTNFDAVGYTAVTFTAASDGRLIITSANFPATGAGQLTAYVSYRQSSGFVQGNYNVTSF